MRVTRATGCASGAVARFTPAAPSDGFMDSEAPRDASAEIDSRPRFSPELGQGGLLPWGEVFGVRGEEVGVVIAGQVGGVAAVDGAAKVGEGIVGVVGGSPLAAARCWSDRWA